MTGPSPPVSLGVCTYLYVGPHTRESHANIRALDSREGETHSSAPHQAAGAAGHMVCATLRAQPFLPLPWPPHPPGSPCPILWGCGSVLSGWGSFWRVRGSLFCGQSRGRGREGPSRIPPALPPAWHLGSPWLQGPDLAGAGGGGGHPTGADCPPLGTRWTPVSLGASSQPGVFCPRALGWEASRSGHNAWSDHGPSGGPGLRGGSGSSSEQSEGTLGTGPWCSWALGL